MAQNKAFASVFIKKLSRNFCVAWLEAKKILSASRQLILRHHFCGRIKMPSTITDTGRGKVKENLSFQFLRDSRSVILSTQLWINLTDLASR